MDEADGFSPLIFWFRRDLRLQDNSGLAAAVKEGRPIIPVFILDEEAEGRWVEGGASKWWLHQSLESLSADLKEVGSRLIVRQGDTLTQLERLLKETGAGAVYWNRRYEPVAAAQEKTIKHALGGRNVEVKTFNSSLLFEPSAIRNKQGTPFKVFSAYWRQVSSFPVAEAVAVNLKEIPVPARWPKSESVADLGLLPKIPWDVGFAKVWQPGEKGAQARLRQFRKTVSVYAKARDFPAEEGTSRLSPHLHFGEIGPRQIWSAIKGLSKSSGVFPVNAGAQKFLAEVGWREFAYYLLHHFPDTPTLPLHAAFAKFPWARDPGKKRLRAWRRGQTGYPIVDAGMRDLWTTGWMPNRLRMITASFLVKHLLQPWNLGADWFWDTLVDADLANNTLGWQWIGGCGADASPFFRIFAPVTQGMKFDPDGEYVRRWVPELAKMPKKYLHAPWEAPADILAKAGVVLGQNYPQPIVKHEEAREAALAAFRKMRGK